MTVSKDRFWAKVLFKEYIRHYRKLTAEQKVADIEDSMDALEDLDDSGDSFGAKMVRWSMDRAEEPSAIASRENGKKGGRPRKEEPGAVAIDSSKGNKSAQAGSHKAGNAIAPIPAATPAEPEVLNLAYSGEFGNVRLTQQEYSELGIRFGNKRALDRAIDSLSCQIENGEKDPKSHYAELVKWATYRDDMDEKKELEDSKPKMTNMEKSWIAAMKKVGIMQ